MITFGTHVAGRRVAVSQACPIEPDTTDIEWHQDDGQTWLELESAS